MKPKRVKRITDTDRVNFLEIENISPAWHRVCWHRRKMELRRAIDLTMSELAAIRQEKRGKK